jgi:hypothetical protein
LVKRPGMCGVSEMVKNDWKGEKKNKKEGIMRSRA